MVQCSDSQELKEISKTQRNVLALSLAEYQKRYDDPKEVMARAYLSNAYTMVEIGGSNGFNSQTALWKY